MDDLLEDGDDQVEAGLHAAVIPPEPLDDTDLLLTDDLDGHRDQHDGDDADDDPDDASREEAGCLFDGLRDAVAVGRVLLAVRCDAFLVGQSVAFR